MHQTVVETYFDEARRSADGSPLSGGDDAAGELPPELMHQLFGGAGAATLLPPPHLRAGPHPNHAARRDPASCGGAPAGRVAHLGTAASAPVMLHATCGRAAAAEFPPMGPRFHGGFAGFGGVGGATGSSQADSAGTRRSQSLTGPSALGGTPGGGGGARMGTSSPDTPIGGGGGSGGGRVGGGRAASARARTAPERAGGWGDADGGHGGSPLQRSTSSNSLQNLGARPRGGKRLDFASS